MLRFFSIAATLLAALALSACASGARSTAMVAELQETALVSADSPLTNAVTVASVSGGEETNPLWRSEVSDEAYADALDTSLDLATLKAATPEEARFALDVELKELDQPAAGFGMTVTSTTSYALRRTEDDSPVWGTEVTRSYRAAFGDAFLGVERLRLANEGSIKANISQFISELVAAAETDPERFSGEPARLDMTPEGETTPQTAPSSGGAPAASPGS